MVSLSNHVKKLLNLWPGKRIFGIYRFLPLFFVFGAGLEYLMIKWNPNNINFYNTYKKKRVQEFVKEKMKSS